MVLPRGDRLGYLPLSKLQFREQSVMSGAQQAQVVDGFTTAARECGFVMNLQERSRLAAVPIGPHERATAVVTRDYLASNLIRNVSTSQTRNDRQRRGVVEVVGQVFAGHTPNRGSRNPSFVHLGRRNWLARPVVGCGEQAATRPRVSIFAILPEIAPLGSRH